MQGDLSTFEVCLQSMSLISTISSMQYCSIEVHMPKHFCTSCLLTTLPLAHYHLINIMFNFCLTILLCKSRNQGTKHAVFGPRPNACQCQNRGPKTLTRKLHAQAVALRTGTHDNSSRSCMQLCGCCIDQLTIRALTAGATMYSWHFEQAHII